MVDLPISSGREQGGQRPAVIIQDEVYGLGSPLILVVILTSQLGALRFPGSTRIDPTPANGVSVPSVAMMFQTRALDRSRFRQRLGYVYDADLTGIIRELRMLTGDP